MARRSAVSLSSLTSRGSISWIVSAVTTDSDHYQRTISNLVGAKPKTGREPLGVLEAVRNRIKSGFPRASFDRLRAAIDVSTEELSALTDIPVRTLARRTKLKADESDRLFRIASVLQRAGEVLESIEAARKWLTSPKRAFGGRAPLEFCDTEAGAREVENLLLRIDQSVYA